MERTHYFHTLAADLALRAGFDGVEIPRRTRLVESDSFTRLEPNRRQDQWGGSLEKTNALSARRHVDAVAAIREKHQRNDFIHRLPFLARQVKTGDMAETGALI